MLGEWVVGNTVGKSVGKPGKNSVGVLVGARLACSVGKAVAESVEEPGTELVGVCGLPKVTVWKTVVVMGSAVTVTVTVAGPVVAEALAVAVVVAPPVTVTVALVGAVLPAVAVGAGGEFVPWPRVTASIRVWI